MNNNYKPPENQIGSAWLKTSSKGGEYLSISFNENAARFDLVNCFIDMWPVEKRSEKSPDYRIMAKPKEQQRQANAAPQQKKSAFPRPKNFAPTAPGSNNDDPEWGF